MRVHQDDIPWPEGSLKFLDQLKLQDVRRFEEEHRLYNAELEDHFLALETIVASASAGIVLVESDPQSAVQLRILYMNPAFSQLSGYRPEDILGKSLEPLLGLQEGDPVRDAIDKCLLGSVSGEFTILGTRRDRSQFSAAIKLVPVRDRLRRCTKWLFEIQELPIGHRPAGLFEQLRAFGEENEQVHSQLRTTQAEIASQPNLLRDPATGLPNSLYFEERVAEELRYTQQRRRRSACVLYLSFRLGAGSVWVGDESQNSTKELYAEVGNLLRAKDMPCIAVAHLGGLHFGLLCEGLDASAMYDVVNTLSERLAAEIVLPNRSVSLISCIGLCHVDAKYSDALEIIRNAKDAMECAMEQGGAHSAWYGDAQNIWLASKTRTSDNGDRPCLKDIEMRYQPQFDVLTAPPRLCAVKAYAYWNHPREGLLSPERLWHAAEVAGLSTPLGNGVMRAACLQMKVWQANVLFPDISLLLEVSENQLTHVDFFAEFVDILAENEVDAQMVYLDVPQDALVHASQAVLDTLQKLRKLGTKIVMVHWGRMNSSILPFDSLPIDAVKLDRSFVKGIGESPYKLDLVKLVVCYAKSLHISVSAEGVLNPADSLALQSCGCTVFEGEFLSGAVPPEKITRLLDEGTCSVLERLHAA